MLIMSFFSWWYGRGWAQVLASFRPRTIDVAQSFSVAQLSRTLFNPWKKIITEPGRSLSDKIRAWGDNLFSRVIGFIVRSTVLIVALLCMLAVGLETVAELAVWPLLPLAIIGLPILGYLL